MTDETGQNETAAPPGKDLVAGFRALAGAERLLAMAAVATVAAFIFLNGWNLLFKHGWFLTCAFLGSVGVTTLIVLDLVGVKVLEARMRIYVLIMLAVLPALGFVVDAFHDTWRALVLAGSAVMAYAGAKITTREQIIRKSE